MSEPQAAYDEYGFPLELNPQQAKARQQCIANQRKQDEKWQRILKAGRLPPADKLKKYCRKGIPPACRAWVWSEVSGAAARQREQLNNYYEAMVHMGEAASHASHQIELDLPRTFPHNSWVPTDDGQAALRRVLLAFSVHKPEVGYCQSMNYVAAMLLLGMDLNEERAFWAMVALMDDNGLLYHDMYASNLSGTHVEMRSLEELLSKKLPRLYKHLQSLSCDMSIIATDWFLCLFSTSLPAETTARVWDALLNEGPKILFRIALALLKSHEDALLAQDNAGMVLREMRKAAQGMHDRDKLMKTAFDGIGSMPMARIDNFRTIKQELVDDEMRKREGRKQLNQALRSSEASAKQFETAGLGGVAEQVKKGWGARLSMGSQRPNA